MLRTGELELDDIQGVVLRIYLSLLHEGAAVFVHFGNAAAGRDWLRQVTPAVTTAAEWDELLAQHREEIEQLLGLSPFDKARLALHNPETVREGLEQRVEERLRQLHSLLTGRAAAEPQPEPPIPTTAVNVALTYKGLAALERPAAELASFPRHFREGMRAHAAGIGDTGPSAADFWDPPFRADDEAAGNELHALLLLHARDASELNGLLAWHDEIVRQSGGGVRVTGLQLAARLPSFTEHFGFKDGIGSPAIEGDSLPAFPGQDRVKAGEFVLGYPDEDGRTYDEVLRPDSAGGDHDALDRYLKNGSFLVYRKLKQNVAAFRRFLREQGGGDPELLAAKMVGRWRSGAPLAHSPYRDNPELARDFMRNNDFDYSDDQAGARVPVGSHIRRANPRKGEVARVNRHRVLRRGIPYGDPLLPDDRIEDDGKDRGILFLFVGASIRRQFLFVQQAWMNDSDFHRRLVVHDEDEDPLIGSHEVPQQAGFTIPEPEGAPRRITGLPNFVATRGGEFFFAPGVRALRYLAGEDR